MVDWFVGHCCVVVVDVVVDQFSSNISKTFSANLGDLKSVHTPLFCRPRNASVFVPMHFAWICLWIIEDRYVVGFCFHHTFKIMPPIAGGRDVGRSGF